jgi:glucokinase
LHRGSHAGLIGDIGGTDARFALVSQYGDIRPVGVYSPRDYSSLAEAINRFLADEAPADRPSSAVLAVASPITGDQITFTNYQAWTFSIEHLRQQLGLERLRVINDFTAIALSVPYLQEADIVQIGRGSAIKDAPIGIIGPGTGLGVSALLPSCGDSLAISGEGGHVTVASVTAREAAVIELLRKRFGHVSAERFLSGPGLINLYASLCELGGVPAAPLTAAQITSSESWTTDPHTREATAMFCAMLGTVAGNLALTLGARGGIYIAGGIVPKMLAFFAASQFRERFEFKGRMAGYLASIPTYIITRSFPALLGAAWSLKHVEQKASVTG